MTLSKITISVFLSSLVVHGLYVFWLGPVMSLDSQTYSRWANFLIDVNFNYSRFLHGESFVIPSYFYTGFVTIVAFLKSVFGDQWHWGLIFLNLLAYAGAATLIARIIFLTTNNSLAALIGAGLFIVNFESFQWVRYVLSDTTFMFLIVATFYLIFNFVLDKSEVNVFFMGTGILLLFVVLTSYRPTAISFLIVFSLLILLGRRYLGDKYRPNLKLFISSVIFIGLVFAAVIQAFFVQDINRWPFDFAHGYMEIISGYFSEGRIIDDRPELNVAPPDAYLSFLSVIFLRFYFFFVFAIDAFSERHVIYNLFTFPITYALALLYLFLPIMARDVQSVIGYRFLGISCTILIVVGAAFSSLLLIDYDWRYRMPIMPFVFILAGLGADRVGVLFRTSAPDR